jgi:putative DNA primase/helicase
VPRLPFPFESQTEGKEGIAMSEERVDSNNPSEEITEWDTPPAQEAAPIVVTTAPPKQTGKKEKKVKLYSVSSIVEELLQTFHIKTLQDTKNILVYNEKTGIYDFNGETFLEKKIERRTKGEEAHRFTVEVIAHIRARTYISRSEINKDKSLIHCLNCILNVDTFQPQPFDPGIISIWHIPVKYNPKARCPQILKFLRQVFKTNDLPTIQEWAGSHLYARYIVPSFMILVGDTHTGKTTFENLVRTFLGEENCAAESPQSLEEDRWSIGNLYGKIANLSDDISGKDLKDTSKLRAMTGNSTMRGEWKGMKLFEFKPCAKNTFACNNLPRIVDDTPAFWVRMLLIVCSHKFPDNYQFSATLTTPKELSGFLNWCLKGLQRLQQFGQFFVDLSNWENTREHYEQISNPLEDFFKESCELGLYGTFLLHEDAYNAYIEFCKERGIPALSFKSFCKIFRKVAGVFEYRPSVGGGRPHAWSGVRLIPKVPPQQNVQMSTKNSSIREKLSESPRGVEKWCTGKEKENLRGHVDASTKEEKSEAGLFEASTAPVETENNKEGDKK